MTKLKNLLKNEPVAAAVGALLAAAFAYLAARGVLTEDSADLIAAAVALMLGIPIAAGARSKVTPLAKLLRAASDRPRE